MIIGAGARLLLLDWKYGLPTQRTSKDWDFAARMISWKQYEQLRDALASGPLAPFRRTAAEHRLQHTSGTLIDLLPFGQLEGPEGTIEWPESHAVMSVIGFSDADEHAIPIELRPGVTIRVVTIPALVALKLIAYKDRSRADDLRDVLFILEYYSRYELEDRIFDELSELLANGELQMVQLRSDDLNATFDRVAAAPGADHAGWPPATGRSADGRRGRRRRRLDRPHAQSLSEQADRSALRGTDGDEGLLVHAGARWQEPLRRQPDRGAGALQLHPGLDLPAQAQ